MQNFMIDKKIAITGLGETKIVQKAKRTKIPLPCVLGEAPATARGEGAVPA